MRYRIKMSIKDGKVIYKPVFETGENTKLLTEFLVREIPEHSETIIHSLRSVLMGEVSHTVFGDNGLWLDIGKQKTTIGKEEEKYEILTQELVTLVWSWTTSYKSLTEKE